MIEESKLEENLKKVTPVTFSGSVHRCVAGAYIDSLASTLGSLKKDGRFTRKDTFRALYTSHYKDIALKELTSGSLFDEAFLGAAEGSEISFSIQVNAKRILDLTVEDIQNLLGTNLQELTGNWEYMNTKGKESPTQILGRVVYYSKLFDALRYPSKHAPNKSNLLIFPDRIDHYLTAHNLPANFPTQVEL